MTGSMSDASVSTFGKDADAWLYETSVMDGGTVTFIASGSKWKNKLSVLLEADGNSQEFFIHTSCSQPLILGEEYGSFQLIDYVGNGGGVTSQHDLYDLTLGAVGPQGPKGDKGDQGPQGKIGAAGADGTDGAQGPQGKVGAAGADGAQGPQGKVGAAGADGAQGPQGKVGAAGADGTDGAQGPQGKVGAAGSDGAQGPQGKMGFPGAQGEQGPQGPQGDPASNTTLMNLTCGTSSVGNTKHCGLGAVSGTHDDVGIILPFGGNIEGFACKANDISGNTVSPRSGVICTIYKDLANSSDGQTTGISCTTDVSGTCLAPVGSASIAVLDSLSIRITGVSGSVSALSGSLVISPTP
ncbi:MAG: collagen-like protein [Gammaproteobacteria bacterium]|nr:collagen-like protein [Gammaproteobacteria bacterium]